MTDKYGTCVYMIKPYVQQEFSVNRAKCLARFGVQHFEYKYTGSNNVLGEPWKISDVTPPTDYVISAHSNTFYGNITVNF